MITSRHHIRELEKAARHMLPLHAVAKDFIQPKYTMNGFEWKDQRGVEGTAYIVALHNLLTDRLHELVPKVHAILLETLQGSWYSSTSSSLFLFGLASRARAHSSECEAQQQTLLAIYSTRDSSTSNQSNSTFAALATKHGKQIEPWHRGDGAAQIRNQVSTCNRIWHGTSEHLTNDRVSSETYQLAMYLLDQYRGTVLSCRYAVPPRLAPAESRTQLEKVVKVAVVDTIMRHPMLQVGMIDATSKTPSWIQLRSLDLTQHIKWLYLGDHADFEQTVQETFRVQLDDRFPDLSAKQPCWKITIIRQGDDPILEVLLTWNHPQFDGAGAKVWHEDFLEMLNTAENGAYERAGLDGDILRLPEAPPLLPTPIESLKSLPLDLKYLAKSVWEEFRPQFLNRAVSQAAWCPIRTSPYKTQFRAFFMDNASLSAILALCRQNKTTITGLLNGLALIAFTSRLDSTVAPAFQSSTIMDHRRNLPPAPPDAPWGSSDRAVSNYVTQLPHRFETELVARIRSKLPANSSEGIDLSADLQRELWAVSAQNRLEIVRKLKAGLRNDLVGVFKYVTDWQKTMSDMAKKTRQFTWLVTNVGVLNGSTSDDQKWSIDRAQFGLSAEIPAAAIEFAPISVAGRGMCVSANWPDCAVDVKFGERIMADLERWLTQLASQS